MSMHPTRNLFKEFPNPYFVETGSYRGDGIQLAIDAGFQNIISMDIDEDNINFCLQRFGMTTHHDQLPTGQWVTLLTVDSAEGLYRNIQNIDQPITFWLDAHAQHLEDEEVFPNSYPLFEELEQIHQHPINTHTILIDDILHLTHPKITGWTNEKIEAWLKVINSQYQFRYFANPVRDNILVAHV